MKLGLNLQASLQQTLTPQQIQYLKLLQLSALQFEQHVRGEVENNPMLEEERDDVPENVQGDESFRSRDAEASLQESPSELPDRGSSAIPADSLSAPHQSDESISEQPQPFDETDAFEFYKLIWGEDPSSGKASDFAGDDDDSEGTEPQFRDAPSLEDELTEQLQFLNLSDEERLFGEYVIGNVDSDGYLRRDINDLIAEVNAVFSEHDLALHAHLLLGAKKSAYEKGLIDGIDRSLIPISLKQADQVVKKIQMLDPPGFASRNVQECLIAQLKSVRKPNAAQKLALLVLTDAYEAFAMKHFNVIERQLDVTEEYLREAIDVIRHLNPRPGSGTIEYEVNTLVPDFIIEKTEDESDFSITVNDSRLPTLRVSNAYERLKREARNHKFNKETREWLRKKYEDAKFLIQAIRQRKSTMLRVMTAIAGLQTEFLKSGPIGLKPLIYRDVAAITGLDISTICRIVNGKYVQTEFGTFELKYFFSESLITEEGEEVSTRIIKQKIRDLIGDESKVKPLSDEKLARDLKKVGYKVARRTVAKYREQLRIPVARLRREL
ncbi:MAG: RNA polymerase factor sigma-54 [Ignavibacteria bacterium]|nr:RNA polymerase factor sigma-54 [Ignavibacteria bacterium]